MLAEEVRVAASTGTADTDWRTETVLSQLWGIAEDRFLESWPREGEKRSFERGHGRKVDG